MTAADISPDGSIILVRTYQQVLAFTRSWDESVAEALGGAPCVAPSRPEPQGEAVAWSAGGDAYFTASEVQLPRTSGWVPVVEPIPWSRERDPARRVGSGRCRRSVDVRSESHRD